MANDPIPMKSLSFDSRIQDENRNKDDNIGIKSFSFASRTPSSEFNDNDNDNDNKPSTIDEGDEQEEEKEITLDQLSEDIHQFSISISSLSNDNEPPEISNVVVTFLKKLESKIEEYESKSQDSMVFGHDVDEDGSFIGAVNKLTGLMDALQDVKSDFMVPLLNQLGIVHHRAMVFLEDELRLILEEAACQNPNNACGSLNSKQSESSLHKLKGRLQSFASHQQDDGGDSGEVPPLEGGGGGGGGGGGDGDIESEEQPERKEPLAFPFISSESVSSIRLIVNAMIMAGYEAECCNVLIVNRRHVFEEELRKQGFEKYSTDDLQKMKWEALEGEISTCIRVFKHVTTTLLPGEETFYNSIFSDHLPTSCTLYTNLSYEIFSMLGNFAEAISMTKRSTEKLFKILDMFETLQDMIPWIESKKTMYLSEESMMELKSELSFAKSRLGEAGVAIFCQLENSIKGDNDKTPVASGAVHPLTRYTMNYLNIACEYKSTLEQVFQHHQKTERSEDYSALEPQGVAEQQQSQGGQGNQGTHSPFSTQLINIMDLLDSYLETKSKLYKDISLRYIFLMNNGRYMLQKVKRSSELHQVVGDNWCRKRSSDVRHYHKSYQRESWSKVLQCLNQEGLQVNGKVHKPILKERFKNFNQLFDEIHRTQSTWVVSDEQLQSELRVSISAIMIPAYRSFVARFGTVFTPGRQVEKYIKFQPDDIENIIEELFNGKK